jgi:CelD/BcsL family acetyltransferase involved in cellulose biosynthesis
VRPRTLRRIEKEGQVGLKVYDSPSSIQANLPILFEQHVTQWSVTSTPSRFRGNSSRELYFQLAEELYPNVVLYVLTVNDLPAASLFGFRYKKKLVVYTLGRDRRCDRFHPGLVCILKVMQTLRADGIDSIDFTRGDEPFKSFFADTASLSYEFLSLKTPKAKFWMTLLLAAKDMAISHPPIKRLAQRLGFQAEGVSRLRQRELYNARNAAAEADEQDSAPAELNMRS